jgi:hypothetical protein
VYDDGTALHYGNQITGAEWAEYYVPLVSQLPQPQYPDPPGWGPTSFVDGVFKNHTVYVGSGERDIYGFDQDGVDRNGQTRYDFARGAFETATNRSFAGINNMETLLAIMAPRLSPDDRAAVTDFLREIGIPYQISFSGQVSEVVTQINLWSNTSYVMSLPDQPNLSFNANGYGSDGYDIFGYDQNGIDMDGYDRTGVYADIKYGDASGTAGGLASPPPIRTLKDADTTRVRFELDRLPDDVNKKLTAMGTTIIAVPSNVAQYYKGLFAVTPGGHDVPWSQIPGGFFNDLTGPDRKNTIIIATGPTAYDSSSNDFAMHEIGHAYDWSWRNGQGYVLSDSQGFRNAFDSDYYALGTRYLQSSYREAFAEVFANYYIGNTEWFYNKPNLLDWAVNNLPPPRPK